MTETPDNMTYDSVVSSKTLCLDLKIVALNDMWVKC